MTPGGRSSSRRLNRFIYRQGKIVTEPACRVVVLASGAGSNFRSIARACSDDAFPAVVAGLITDNPDAGARGIAEQFNIPVSVVPVTEKKGRLPGEAEREIAAICRKLSADLIALAGFMRILKGPILDGYAEKIMNIHPALLPSFKGLHAQRQALEYGVKVAGCTVHFVDRSIDGGQIILQAAVPVRDDDDDETLSRRILAEEHRIYPEAIALFARGLLKVDGRRVRIISSS
jgi:phosphoribosylglycinamide formyltransferase-1